MDVNVEGKEVSFEEGAICRDIFKESLSGKKFKSVLAAKCGSILLDLDSPVPLGCKELSPVMPDSPEGLEMIRHSAAHVMATAVKRLFPKTKVTIGPAIDSGFYYDFDGVRPFTQEDFAAIEAEMRHIIADDVPFVRKNVSKQEAIDFFKDLEEGYKVEIIESINEEQVSLYYLQEFVDLCRGPHVPSTGAVKSFSLLSVAGAYWRGSEKNKMLSRIYGTAFASESDLKKYLFMLEEAKRRDHRKLGKELDLFDFKEDVSPGMVFWHPKGMLIRTILEDFLRKEHLKRGYQLVQGPQLLRRELWERSGHYDNYRENMYFSEIEGDVYGIKPMNCLAHMIIYGSKIRSYRDLPVRYAELGVVHRHEMSGALHGLLRVRQFTQDDAHIICRPDQLQDEIISVMTMVRDIFNLFDFSYSVALSTRPEKFIGTIEAWDKSTESLREALEATGIPYTINEGDGAFYGPKIDCRVTDSLGREWQCSTIQCDFTLPERFSLEYIGQDGDKHRPVMVHRAILGSLERFIGVLIEHCAGLFPIWLSPVQARIVTVTDSQLDYARTVLDSLRSFGIRVELDTRNEKLGYKVRSAQIEKVPYVLVIGDKELEDKGVNVRLHGGETLGFMSIDKFAEHVLSDCEEPFKRGGMHYRFT